MEIVREWCTCSQRHGHREEEEEDKSHERLVADSDIPDDINNKGHFNNLATNNDETTTEDLPEIGKAEADSTSLTVATTPSPNITPPDLVHSSVSLRTIGQIRSLQRSRGVGGGGFAWVGRRLAVVIVCLAVDLLVSNLSLLVALCGSFASPGLVAMCSLIHLKFVKLGIEAPISTLRKACEVGVAGFCVVVFAGTYFIVRELV
jgi:hypothetical protein